MRCYYSCRYGLHVWVVYDDGDTGSGRIPAYRFVGSGRYRILIEFQDCCGVRNGSLDERPAVQVAVRRGSKSWCLRR